MVDIKYYLLIRKYVTTFYKYINIIYKYNIIQHIIPKRNNLITVLVDCKEQKLVISYVTDNGTINILTPRQVKETNKKITNIIHEK